MGPPLLLRWLHNHQSTTMIDHNEMLARIRDAMNFSRRMIGWRPPEKDTLLGRPIRYVDNVSQDDRLTWAEDETFDE